MRIFNCVVALCVALCASGDLADQVDDFIDGDDELALLMWENVESFFDPAMLMETVTLEEYAEADAMTVEELDSELNRLHDKLQMVYDTFLAFARVLASLTAADLMEMADRLNFEPDLYERLMNDPSRKLMKKLQVKSQSLESDEGYDEFDDDHEQELIGYCNDPNFEPSDDLTAYDQNGSAYTDVWYCDPDSRYEMFAKLLEDGPDDLDAIEKMGIITLTKENIKKVKIDLKKIKKKVMIIAKITKLKLLVKKKRVVICIKSVILIEKIKRLIISIIRLIKKSIICVIKELPWDVLWRIKIVIRLLVKVLSDIIWELEIIILEIVVKVAVLLKKLAKSSKVPPELIMYFKMVLMQKLGLLDIEDDQEGENWQSFDYFLKVWPDDLESDEILEQTFEVSSAGHHQATFEAMTADDGTDIEFVESDAFVVPGEFYEVFGSVLTKEEIDAVFKADDAFNFDVVFPGEEQEQLAKRQILQEMMPDGVNAEEFAAFLEKRELSSSQTVFRLEDPHPRNHTDQFKHLKELTNYGSKLTMGLSTLAATGLGVGMYIAYIW